MSGKSWSSLFKRGSVVINNNKSGTKDSKVAPFQDSPSLVQRKKMMHRRIIDPFISILERSSRKELRKYCSEQYGLKISCLRERNPLGYRAPKNGVVEPPPYLKSSGIVLHCLSTNKILCVYQSECRLWSLPKGTYENRDLTPKHTAVREFKEETGFDIDLSNCSRMLVFKNRVFYSYYYYVAVDSDADFDTSLFKKTREIGEVKWMDVDYLSTFSLKSNSECPRNKHLSKTASLIYNGWSSRGLRL